MADKELMRAPKGMLDVLPPESAHWIDLVARFAALAERYGYGLVVTPIVEHYEVFARVGATTDVVRKEMYEFVDRGGRRLALRPEGTAPVVRAFVQHWPSVPWKVWYVAPNFRAEQPQAGRYRQHWQLGVEVLGIDDPDIDIEVIALAHDLYRELGLRQVRLLINSMGDAESRARYRDVLLEYWRAHAQLIGGEMERAEANPLRILDSKRPDWQEMLERAPQLGEYLTDASAAHFARVQEGLRALGIAFEIAPRLVRGFDYYTGAVFEFQSETLEAAQNAVGGGGRLDRLAEEMGGPATPALGFGIGIERLLLACDAEGVLPRAARRLDVFVVDAVGTLDANVLLYELRESGLSADRAYGGRALRRQLELANKSGAQWSALFLPAEWSAGHVKVKDMYSGKEIEVRREEAAAWLQTRKDESAT
jgi:histidyl-tRNA synthetase